MLSATSGEIESKMPFVSLGDRLVNTDHIVHIQLHGIIVSVSFIREDLDFSFEVEEGTNILALLQ